MRRHLNEAARHAKAGTAAWVHVVHPSPVPPVSDGSYNFLVWQLLQRRAPKDVVVAPYFGPSFMKARDGTVPVIHIEGPRELLGLKALRRVRHKLEQRNVLRFNTKIPFYVEAAAIAREYGAKMMVWGDIQCLPQVRLDLPQGTIAFAQRHYDFPYDQRHYDRCDIIIMQTPGQARYAFDHMNRLTPFLLVIPNGVETDIFRPAVSSDEVMAARKKWRIPEDRIIVMFPSKLAPHKGTSYLEPWIAYCRTHLTQVHFLIVGKLDASLKKWHKVPLTGVLRGSENVTWMEGVSRSEMPSLYRSADICLMPGVWREGFSMASIEAMASGIPVIASEAGCYRETIIHGYNGLLSPREDLYRTVLAAMRLLADRPRLKEALGRNARTYCELNLSRERVLSNFDAFLEGDYLAIDNDLRWPDGAESLLDADDERTLRGRDLGTIPALAEENVVGELP